MQGAKQRWAAVFLVCLLLLLAAGCATERWCNDLNDYSTLETDMAHCRRKAGFLGQVVPGSLDDCMESLGWKACPPKRQDGE
ncbi:MAG: hypothetical protein KQI62_06560 [Deltaproteobacteria bacterium]|nr:hypothetical protein [Deltaproteobacteria bacterium]